MSTPSFQPTASIGPAIAIGTLLVWAWVLLHPASPIGVSDLPSFVRSLAILWYLLSLYLWMVPAWRRLVIERRGPLLGFGFAFGAAFVSSVADGFHLGGWTALGIGAWRLIVLLTPFIPPLVMRLPRRPHPIDLAVVLLALFLPGVPGFKTIWVAAAAPSGTSGILNTGIGPGALSAAALLWTYFYGVRFWTLAPLDLKARSGDVATLVAAWFLGIIAVSLLSLAPGGFARWPKMPVAPWDGAWWILTGIGLAVLLEELVFRCILQSWMTQALTRRFSGRARPAGVVAAVAAAFLHAGFGPFGLSRELGFVISLALGLVYTKSNRYFPMVIAHALILLTLAAAARLF